MTAEELLKDLDDCYGTCGKICMSCPEARYLKEIRDVIVELMKERDKYKLAVDVAEDIPGFYEMLDANDIQL